MQHFISPSAMHVGSSALTSSPKFIIFIIAIIMVVRLFLSVVLICISLLTDGVEHLSSADWPFACLL